MSKSIFESRAKAWYNITTMVTPFLTAKLYIPPPRPNLVQRPRLIEQLEAGLRLGNKLSLVSAPPGFGKTTLITEWVCRSERDVAWISLDEGDNDPARFLTYLVAALRQVDGTVVQRAQNLLQTTPLLPPQNLITLLVNDIAAANAALLLVLDDYHWITSTAIHQTIEFLLEHQPPLMHTVISTRQDPPLPLSRLRARAQLTEIRERDLRFTLEETASFLSQATQLNLSAEDVAVLESRIEGWVAGLQLATLSVRDRDDITDIVKVFSGSNRYILDYLVEEVLRRQPEEVQRFLLLTSILSRMTGPLCNALTGASDGQAMLEQLEESNLFIVPLTPERTWYRYHNLFAEFLRNRLRKSFQEQAAARIAELHRRASAWFEEQELLAEAVEHALEAQDMERAAHLIEKAGRRAMVHGEMGLLGLWLEKLPDGFIRRRPYLCLAHAWTLAIAGQFAAAEQRATAATVAVEDTGILGEAAAVRALVATLRGDSTSAIDIARQALDHLPPDDLFLRGMVALNLGRAYDIEGNLPAAAQVYEEAHAIGQTTGNAMLCLMATGQLGELKELQGRLHEAAAVYRQAIELADEPGNRLPVAGIAYIGLGRLHYEWNDLEAATRYLTAATELGQEWVDFLVAGTTYLAQVLQAQGDEEGMRDLIRQAERAARGAVTSPSTVSVAEALHARMRLQAGDTDAAIRWARDYQARRHDEPGYLHRVEDAVLVRVRLAQHKSESALDLLDALLPAAETAGQAGSTIELLVLQAVAWELQRNPTRAMTALHRALTLGEPEGYARSFVDEGLPMARLLQQAAARGVMTDYVGRLLAQQRPASPLVTKTPPAEPLVEPLTEREMDVLHLIAAGLSNREIAGQLVITVGTVKRHTNNIYGKLGVHSRTQAVARAQSLRLLSDR